MHRIAAAQIWINCVLSPRRGQAFAGLLARSTWPWTAGNMVRPLNHGETYFAKLHQRVSQMRDGDLLMFVD